MGDMASRMERLEAIEEIRQLASRYCVAVDDRDLAALGAIFAVDASLIGEDGRPPANSRKEILDAFRASFDILGPTYHWTHDHMIEIDPGDPDSARGLVLSHVEIAKGGKAYIAALRYKDIYSRVDDRWCIKQRVSSFFYYVPTSEYSEALPDRLRLRGTPDHRAANYPESLPSWTSWRSETL